YLWFLGVHPTMQGAGVGSRLLAAKTARLDAAGRAAFLEPATPRNVPLYARHGFETIAEYRPAPGGPLIWAMWRSPGAGR
ncbi:GNAT family N-acetyltransferase, partial [Acinetobacter baumannii]